MGAGAAAVVGTALGSGLVPSGALAAPALARQPDGELIFVEGTDVTTFDPHQVTDTPTTSMLHLLYDGLVHFDYENTFVPVIADSWETNDDVWTFKLKSGVTFSDGSALTADDVVYSFERLKDPRFASPYAALFEVITEIRAVDDTTVEFVTDGPFADLLVNLASPNARILSRKAAEGKDAQTYGLEPVGTGPWMLGEWITGDRAEFVPNPNYWGEDAPQVEKIVYRPVPEASTRAAMLQTGEADIAVKISPEDVPSLEGNSDVTVLQLPSMYEISIELNTATTSPPIDMVQFRKALNHAVDKEAIVQAILGGFGDVATSPFGPGIQFRVEFEPYAYDPDLAKQMLAEAGAEGAQVKMWSPDGRYLKDRQVSEAVQGYLQAVGLQADLQIWEWAPYTAAIREDDTRQAFMVGRATPGADYTATRLFSSNSIGQYNLTNFSDDRIDELLVQGRQTFDEAERAGIYEEIQKIWWESAPWIFLHNQRALSGHRNNVSGLEMWPQEVFDLRHVAKG
jgi:peptide/nickel transport system substrate-binding protein